MYINHKQLNSITGCRKRLGALTPACFFLPLPFSLVLRHVFSGRQTLTFGLGARTVGPGEHRYRHKRRRRKEKDSGRRRSDDVEPVEHSQSEAEI